MTAGASALGLLPRRVVVGLDGSDFGERSLPAAADLAEAIGAELTLLSVVDHPDEFSARAAYLVEMRKRHGGQLVLLLEDDIRRALARRPADELLCLATRGRSAVVHSLLGSVAFSEVAAGRETLLVGSEWESRVAAAPVVVPVSSGVDYHHAIGIAAAWADRLAVPVVVVTVESDAEARPTHTANHAVAALHALGVEATATVLPERDDAVESLVEWSLTQPASLIVAPSSVESGQPRALLRSRVADLVGQVGAPVLAVPSPGR